MTAPIEDYPLAEKQPDQVKSPSGIPLNEITLERL
ncbi:MAG: propanediol dehydratase small subunit PduE, partial [Candidatus Latescibacteria bacterium]|nr:propanediol dehydratase small subunit PduE [Candidatus Latescibacterota bacterium]